MKEFSGSIVDRFLTAVFIVCIPGCSGGANLSGDGGEDDAIPDVGIDEGSEAVPDVHPDSYPDTDHDDGDAADTASDHCDPMDAVAVGGCEEELPGFLWDGGHCVSLGSGCECEGPDCPFLYSTIEQCVAAKLECYDVSCDPQPVAEDTCMDCSRDDIAFLGAFWNGRECFSFFGCYCRGEGCSDPFPSMEECEAVHAGCDSVLCRSTGGIWFPASAGFCGFECGAPRQCTGLLTDSCFCGPGRTFSRGVGCEEDPSCSEEQLCTATRGTWHPASECICGFTCGIQNVCGACLDSCNCGPHRNFDPAAGCIPDVLCEGAAFEDICGSTGGTWVLSTCGHYGCGFPSDLACVEPGCDCGHLSNFDSAQGCLYDALCTYRDVWEECYGTPRESSCRPGLACCPGEPITMDRFCGPPCCPDDSMCSESGCEFIIDA